MKKIIFLLICVLLYGCKQPENLKINLIHTNDLHAHLLPFNEYGDCTIDSQNCLGGFARITSFMLKEKQEHPDSIILDAGDRFTGTAFYTLTKSRYLLPLFELMPYDAATLGNHEFDDNLSETVHFISRWHTPILAANILSSAKEPISQYIKPSKIIERDGRKIGIIGVTTPEINILGGAAIEITPIKQAIADEIQKLKNKQINIIIVLSHIGLTQDIKLAKALPDIDIIVGGHSHSLLTNDKSIAHRRGEYPMTVNKGKTLIVTCGMGGQYVGKLQAEFNADGEIISYNGDAVPMTVDTGVNPQATKIIANAQAELNNILSEKIIELPQSYGYTDGTDYCSQECPVGEYITFLLAQEYPEVDGVILNSGAVRSALPAGTITFNQILEVYPYDNPAVIIELSGKELKKFLRHGIAHYHKRGKTNELLQTSGISYAFTTDDKRIENVMIKGQPLDLNKKYKLLTSMFIANGGDRYPIKSYTETGSTVREIIVNQMKNPQNRVYYLKKNVQIIKNN
ncbi:MAG: bifunctional metallophosphatase/5'-nucleotidase [Alphaproteobacteria bacterium]|nr:bifunctional metallophosphatase/5'-nucleotidase [Alphaproteobacteria bacterium]